MRNKIIIIIAVVLLAIVLLLFNLNTTNKEEFLARFKSEQTIASHQISAEIESYLTNMANEIKILSRLLSNQNLEIKTVAHDINMFYDIEEDEHVKAVSVYNENGTIIYSTSPKAIGRNYGGLDFFQWAENKENKDKQFISSLIVKTNDKDAPLPNFRFLLVSPIYQLEKNENQSITKEKFAGIVTSTIDLEEVVSEYFKFVNSTTAIGIYIIESNGSILYHSNHPEMVLKNINSPEESCYDCHTSFDHFGSILSNQEGNVEYALKDAPVELASFSSVDAFNISWKIVLTMPNQKISDFTARNFKITLVIIGIITLILAGGFVFILHINRSKIKADEEAKRWKEKGELEDVIRENEERFRLLYENSPIGLYRTNPAGEILLANNILVDMLGYSSFEELAARNLEKEGYVVKSERSRFIEEIEKKYKTKNREELWFRKDGTTIWVRENARKVTDADGKTLFYDGTVEDISEQKRADLEREVLYEIIHSAAKTDSLDELLELIHHSLGKIVYVKNYFIALYDPETQLFNFPYFLDKYDTIPEPTALRKSCTAYIFKTGKPLLLTQKLFDQLAEKKEVELVGTNSPSFVGVPLSTPSGTIGVLVLQHYEEENVYSERDVEFLNSVGSQIAAAIERKRSEDELRESEIMFRKLFDESTDPILLLEDRAFTKCNAAAVSILGYSSKEEFLSKNPWELSPERQPDGLLSSEKAEMVINKAIEKGFYRFEWIHTKADGSDLPVEVMLTSIQLKGKPIIYTVWRDITERLQAERELQNERLLLRTVIDNIPDSIYCKDLEGRKTLANPTEVKLSGVKSESEILGKTDFDCYPREMAEGFAADDQIVIQKKEPVLNREEYLIDQQGQKKWLLTSKIPMKDESGEVIGLVGIGRDITDRIGFAQEIKERNEELLKLNAEKDKFFSIIAHDLKSPFSGFLNLTELMSDSSEEFTPAEYIENMQSLNEAARKLYKLLENLLEWAQIQKGSIEFTPTETELSKLVAQSIDTICERAKQKKITIISEIDNSLKICSDEKMISTVFRNLLSNAVKFTRNGGRVVVKSKQFENNKILISVADNGVGIPERDINRLFKIEEKVRSLGTDGETSTGLGLLLCKEFIEMHGGEIWVESEINKGSIFYFTIPIPS